LRLAILVLSCYGGVAIGLLAINGWRPELGMLNPTMVIGLISGTLILPWTGLGLLLVASGAVAFVRLSLPLSTSLLILLSVAGLSYWTISSLAVR
jgi:hypothetical protein